jgi:hypothetical protein
MKTRGYIMTLIEIILYFIVGAVLAVLLGLLSIIILLALVFGLKKLAPELQEAPFELVLDHGLRVKRKYERFGSAVIPLGNRLSNLTNGISGEHHGQCARHG